MSVYFFRKFGWNGTFFYLQDGDQGDKQYGGIRGVSPNEYYNSFQATQAFCQANGLKRFCTISSLDEGRDPIDFCYSFAAIGFHWSIELYLDRLAPRLAPNALLLFELKAPLSAEAKLRKESEKEYREFYDRQLAFASQHAAFEVDSLVTLENYKGDYYREPSHFLLLRPR